MFNGLIAETCKKNMSTPFPLTSIPAYVAPPPASAQSREHQDLCEELRTGTKNSELDARNARTGARNARGWCWTAGRACALRDVAIAERDMSAG